MIGLKSFQKKVIKMHRDQALSLNVRRQSLRNKMKLNSLINWTITSILIIGCLTQIISIFDLYLRYPTNIFIETKFKSYYRPLPAITFCTNIGKQSGQSTDQLFLDYKMSNYMSVIAILYSDDS